MKKLRTLTQLQDQLDQEYSWRIKELADLKLAVRGTGALQSKTIVRASVPLVYAHWEGFIKQASLDYVNHVNNQGLRYEQLKSCFIIFGIKKKLEEITSSRSYQVNIAAVEFLLTGLGQRADLKMAGSVDTESNLSSKVFANIALSIGLDVSFYESRYHLIDESILYRRNKIAHGEYLDLNSEECRNLIDEVIVLLRAYKNDIENAASARAYAKI